MPQTLNDIIDLFDNQPELDAATVTAYGFKMAPCLREEVTINRATEYILQINGRVKRVYNWEQSGRDGRMYVKDEYGQKAFLPEEIVTMLTYGNPSYDSLKYVAQSVKVAA